MLPIAGQTAGPNGLIFLRTLMGGCHRLKKKKKFQRGPSASNI